MNIFFLSSKDNDAQEIDHSMELVEDIEEEKSDDLEVEKEKIENIKSSEVIENLISPEDLKGDILGNLESKSAGEIDILKTENIDSQSDHDSSSENFKNELYISISSSNNTEEKNSPVQKSPLIEEQETISPINKPMKSPEIKKRFGENDQDFDSDTSFLKTLDESEQKIEESYSEIEESKKVPNENDQYEEKLTENLNSVVEKVDPIKYDTVEPEKSETISKTDFLAESYLQDQVEHIKISEEEQNFDPERPLIDEKVFERTEEKVHEEKQSVETCLQPSQMLENSDGSRMFENDKSKKEGLNLKETQTPEIHPVDAPLTIAKPDIADSEVAKLETDIEKSPLDIAKTGLELPVKLESSNSLVGSCDLSPVVPEGPPRKISKFAILVNKLT